MSVNQYLTDASTRHAVFLQRYAGGQSKKARGTLLRLRRDINARLAQEPTDFQRNRLNAVLTDIDALYAAFTQEMSGQVRDGALKLAADEAEFSATLYNKVSDANFSLPSDGALIAAVQTAPMTAPMAGGAITIDEALRQYGAKKAEQVTQAIADAVVLGDTTPEISRKVGTLISTLQRRQLDTLVRTITNHSSSVARSEVYRQNADILDGYKWVSTLDSRTTLVCAGRDGEVYQTGVGPMPPAHWGCRSTTVPQVAEEFTLAKRFKGKRPSIGGDGAKQVSTRTTYGGWLRKQPREFIDEALGPERAKLFVSGKLSIDKFTDPTGRVYTLEELARVNKFAFQEI